MVLGPEKFKSKRVTICENGIYYKFMFKEPQTLFYTDVGEMTDVYIADGNSESFYLSLYDKMWHYIKLDSFPKKERFDILNYMLDKLLPIILPKHLERFNENKEINLGPLSVIKNVGITRTNNITRVIKWLEIDSFEFKLNYSGVGKGIFLFGDEVFEFLFKIGNSREHFLMLEIMKQMIGSKIKTKPDNNNAT